ncbi:MAG: asparagine synthase (glutamine-hydrolyzing) [Bacteroidetes bacterium]|nr:asparagine synthase (glutamine-hydrolyzing) [Bacteroidota bacterium]
MCGISGIIGLNQSKAQPLIVSMMNAMKHRGPDAQGSFVEDGVALGHVRLSIIDLSHGADQPLHESGGRYVIVFNGEIYNYQEVKAELNFDWKTNSDTEVILAAYMKWGKDCLSKLNGMFAFAIWDKQEKHVFIARDRMGIKPFYYSIIDGVLVFSSEIRSLLASQLVPRKIDKQGLCEYLSRIAVKTPRTILSDVHQLLPGYSATFKNGSLKTEQYWTMAKKLNTSNQPKSIEEARAKTLDLFKQSIKRRMVADVPVGAFLSGGIDSSAAVAAMAEQSPNPVSTFSIIFDEKEFDESTYARMIAEKYKTNHTEILLKPKMLIEELPGFFNDLDSPTVDGINTYLVSKLVKDTGIKVVLTGLGGDELFAGYQNFKRWKKFKQFGFLITNPLSKALVAIALKLYPNRALAKINDLQKSSTKGFTRFYNNSRSIFLKQEMQQLIDMPCDEKDNFVDLNSPEVQSLPTLSQYSVGEMSNYTLDVLIKDTDQMSMAWALEVREPFFDYELIEYVLGVQDEFKFEHETPKSLLVKAMGASLPDDIVYRPKKGFSFPWDYWLRNELKTYCQQSIEKLEKRQLFKSGSLLNYWNRFLNRDKSITWTHVWAFVVLEQWMDKNNIEA